MIPWHPEGENVRVAYVGDLRLILFKLRPDEGWRVTLRGYEGLVGLPLDAPDEQAAQVEALKLVRGCLSAHIDTIQGCVAILNREIDERATPAARTPPESAPAG